MLSNTQIAQICHEANRAFRQIVGEDPRKSWENATEQTRESAIQGVIHARNGGTPEQLHDNWLVFKMEHGWVYGETISEEEKTHPCILPYEELSAEDKLKDRLFLAIVQALS